MKKLVKLLVCVAMVAAFAACTDTAALDAAKTKAQNDASSAGTAAQSAETASQQATAAADQANGAAQRAGDAAQRANDAVARLEAAFSSSVTK